MNKIYTRINWQNLPSEETPLNETNLNKLDYAADELDNRVVTLDGTKASKSDVLTMVQDVTFDESTGIFSVIKKNGSVVNIDTKLEKIAINWRFDYETQNLILILDDGTEQYVDLSSLVTQFEFLESDTILLTVDSTGKVSATIKEGSIEGKHLEPDYLSNIILEAEKATVASEYSAASAELSRQYKEEAKQYAEEAKASTPQGYEELVEKVEVIESSIEEVKTDIEEIKTDVSNNETIIASLAKDKICDTKSGENVVIKNATESNNIGLKIFGKTVNGINSVITEIKTISKNICDGINQNIYLNNAVNFAAALDNNSGLAIPTYGLGTFTISTTVSQARYRVACANSIPSSSGVSTARGVKKDGTADAITIDTTGYKYLIINATTLSAIQVEQGNVATMFEEHKESVANISYTLRGITTDNEEFATYTDENGQMWIADELDFINKKKTQRISNNGELLDGYIETDINASDMKQINSLKLYSGYTLIVTDSNANISITYYTDTQCGEFLNSKSSSSQNVNSEKKYIFIGDSIACGYNPEPIGFVESWQPKLARLLGLTSGENYFAYCEGGAGFLHTGNEGHSFKGLLESNISTFDGFEDEITDILIVAGHNDLIRDDGEYTTISEVEGAIADFMNYCKTTFPNALVTIGFIGFSCTYYSRLQFANVVKPAYDRAALYGARNINNLQFCLHHRNFYTDGIHITEEGEETLAIQVASFLRGGEISASSGLEKITLTLMDGTTTADILYAKLENDYCTLIPFQGAGDFATWINSTNITNSWVQIGTYTGNSVLFGSPYCAITCPAIIYSNSDSSYHKTTCSLLFSEEEKVWIKAKEVSGNAMATFNDVISISLMFNEVQINSWFA